MTKIFPSRSRRLLINTCRAFDHDLLRHSASSISPLLSRVVAKPASLIGSHLLPDRLNGINQQSPRRRAGSEPVGFWSADQMVQPHLPALEPRRGIRSVLLLVAAFSLLVAACSGSGGEAIDGAEGADGSSEDGVEGQQDPAGATGGEGGLEPTGDSELNSTGDSADDELPGLPSSIEGAFNGECVAGSVSIVSSGPMDSILRRAAESYARSCPEAVFILDAVDNSSASWACDGTAQLVGTSGGAEEGAAANCESQGTSLVSMPVAAEASVVVTNLSSPAPSCLNTADVYALAGSESDGLTAWGSANSVLASSQLGSGVAVPDGELAVVGIGGGHVDQLAFEQLILGPIASLRSQPPTVRSDAIVVGSAEELVAAVVASDAAIAWTSIDVATANADQLRILALSPEPSADCVEPTLETIAANGYTGGRSLVLNVAANNADPLVDSFITHLLADGYETSIRSANGSTGYVSLGDAGRQAAASVWSSR